MTNNHPIKALLIAYALVVDKLKRGLNLYVNQHEAVIHTILRLYSKAIP